MFKILFWVYLYTQLYTTAYGLYNKGKINKSVKKIVKEKNYEFVEKNYIDKLREYPINIIKGFIPFYYGIETSKLLEEILTSTPEEIIEKRLKTGEIRKKENFNNNFQLRNRLLLDNENINSYKAGPNKIKYIGIDGEKADMIFDSLLDTNLENYKGITPFVDQINPNQLLVDTTNIEGFITDKNLEACILGDASVEQLDDLTDAIIIYTDLRRKKEERTKKDSNILKYKKKLNEEEEKVA